MPFSPAPRLWGKKRPSIWGKLPIVMLMCSSVLCAEGFIGGAVKKGRGGKYAIPGPTVAWIKERLWI